MHVKRTQQWKASFDGILEIILRRNFGYVNTVHPRKILQELQKFQLTVNFAKLYLKNVAEARKFTILFHST